MALPGGMLKANKIQKNTENRNAFTNQSNSRKNYSINLIKPNLDIDCDEINLKRKDELNIIPLNKNIVYDYEKHVYNLYDTPNYVPIVNEYVSDKIKIFKNKSSSRTTINKFKAFFSMNKIYIELNDVICIFEVSFYNRYVQLYY